MADITDEEREIYLHGRCHLLALALHELTAKPIYAAIAFDADVECDVLVHCWVKGTEEGYLDASGITSTEASLEQYPDGDIAEVLEVDVKMLKTFGEGSEVSEDFDKRFFDATFFAQRLLLELSEREVSSYTEQWSQPPKICV